MPKDKAAELEQLCDRLYLIDYVEPGFKEFNPDLDGKRNWQPQPKAIGFRGPAAVHRRGASGAVELGKALQDGLSGEIAPLSDLPAEALPYSITSSDALTTIEPQDRSELTVSHARKIISGIQV